MRPVLTAAQMRDADRRTIEEVGLPPAVLMENAGAAVARVLRERYPGARRPLVLCGRGNNGGDGFVIARHLLDLSPSVFLVGSRQDVRGEARLHMGALERSGGTLVEVGDEASWAAVRAAAAGAGVAVDALLGTGLHEAPTGTMARAIGLLRALRAESGLPVIAVDIPSGVPSDTGEVTWDVVDADVTVTFAAPKYGLVLPPACDHAGALVVADIGIAPQILAQSGPTLFLADAGDAAQAYPPRPPSAHKGTFGHVLVVAGAVGRTGAAILAGTGALVSGAGLVSVATPAPALATVAQGRPELMTEPLPVTASGSLDREAAARGTALARTRDAVVIGPGLGQEAAVREFVRDLLRAYTGPVVVDADGLNALAASHRVARATDALRRDAPIIVTPHPGEMGRLVGVATAEVQRRRLETARAFAIETGAVVVLKGQRTVVARPDGVACVIPTGNPGMATGGTGDVLSGILGALLARGLDGWTAAVAGAYLHGAAGDEAAARRGQESLVAGDLLESIPAVLRGLRPAPPHPESGDAHS
jgi:ADP-dependent NAD(P)H-hydrate dehydratase / NAD(P)H-hydrate epimerase